MASVLETKRLVLRRFTDDDVDSLAELDSDPSVSRPGRTFRILSINDSSDDYHAVWAVGAATACPDYAVPRVAEAE
jgi:RimJ/RimL family protein N-acetyltransferase